MSTIGITGASGFVGRHLVDAFRLRGHQVIALGRDARRAPAGCEFRAYEMDAEPAASSVVGMDVIVHCAFIRAERGARNIADRNIQSTRAIYSAAKEAGAKFVFLSTQLARPDANSEYGRHKYATEAILAQGDAIIIRPGLVVGDGGLIRTLYRSLQRGVAPLIDGGEQLIPVVGTDDLATAIAMTLEAELRGRQTICAGAEVSIAEIARSLSQRFQFRPRYVSVPWGAAYLIANISERLGIRVPLTTESLLGMRGFVTEAPSTELAALGFRARSWSELLPLLSFGPPDGIRALSGE